jgi:hypothetical protein
MSVKVVRPLGWHHNKRSIAFRQVPSIIGDLKRSDDNLRAGLS